MEDIEVPSFFICPISLEIMRDPVTLPTGITYDRISIEKWLFTSKNNTCPVTKQLIEGCDLTPNHMLRRLIQSWCMLNASYGVERIPTPKPPINKTQIVTLMDEVNSPLQLVKCLRKLSSVANESDANKRIMEASGVAEFLVSIIIKYGSGGIEQVITSYEDESGFDAARPSDESLRLLYNLNLSEPSLKRLVSKNDEFIESLIRVMKDGHYESRAYAVMMLKAMTEVADPMLLINLRQEMFNGIVQILNDQISQKASKATLQLLIILCPWGRNRIKAVEAGAVRILVDLLLDSPERRHCELMLTALELLCQCAEGRAELLSHGAGLAMVSKKILRVSQVASERAVRILYSISKFSASSTVLQEMLQLGVVAKLCLMLQVECGTKTKQRAREILKFHSRVWKNSPCIPIDLVSSYPA